MANQSRPQAWELLRNRNFMLLWCAYGVSAMGDHLSEMAILKTQDALSTDVDITPLMARMTFMLFLPFLVFSPLTGLLADRLPRRGLMIFADVARLTIMLFFAALITWTQGAGPWGPFLPLMLVGVFAATFSPARSALLPTLIRPDQLIRANGLMAGLGIVGTMGATVAGGFLAKYYPPLVAFRLDALTFLLSVVFLALMRPPRQRRAIQTAKHSAVKDILGGFRYAACHRHVKELLIVAALVWFCGALVISVIPAIARDVYGGGYPMISGFRGLLGVGFIIGAVMITSLGSALRSEIAISWGLLGIAVSIGILACTVFLPFGSTVLATIGGVGVVGTGLFGVSVMASFNALLQRVVADRYRGRVYGVKDVVCTAALLIATGALGLSHRGSVDAWVGHILIGVALITFVAGLVSLRVRLRRRGQDAFLTFAQHFNEFLTRWWWRFERIGPSTVPHEGPVIVTANHACSADPLFLSASVLYRPMSFMVAAEYTVWPVFRWFMGVVECIPVKRDIHDTGATKQAIRHLRAGKVLGIFIQGRIVTPGESAEPKDGVAMLALKTGAVVVPAYISGVVPQHHILKGLFTRHRARVRFGKPVDLSEFQALPKGRDRLSAATHRIYNAILALAPDSDALSITHESPTHTSSRGELTHESA